MLRRDEIVDAGSQSCMLVVTVFALARNQADEIIFVLKAFVGAANKPGMSSPPSVFSTVSEQAECVS